jgi:glycerate kinase
MIISFNTFLAEETEESGSGKKLKHLKHIEDMHIHDGHEGVGNAAQILSDVHKSLLGKKTDTNIFS